MPDIAIIGAGPAGSVAAILLARRGWNVTLIEQHRFPRDKVCGECLSALAIDVLDRHGLLNRLRSAAPAELRSVVLHAPDGRHAQLELPRPMWGLSRLVMDALLLDIAREAGVNIHQPERCESVSAGSRPSVAVRNLITNQTQTLTRDFIIIADGKAALAKVRPAQTGDFGIKAHFTHIDGPSGAIELFGLRGTYGGLSQIEGGKWNTAFNIPGSMIRACRGDFDALFANLLRGNRSLRARFKHATRASDWMAAPLPRFAIASTWQANIIHIGNAAAALEPLGGEGMGLAMRSAELAVLALDSAKNEGDCHFDSLRSEFKGLWQWRRAASRATAMVISSPPLAGMAIEIAGRWPGLSGAAFAALGKSANGMPHF